MKDEFFNLFLSQKKEVEITSLILFLFIILIVLLSIVFNLSFFSSEEKIFSDQNLYYYTFSTIVQGFLALVAFLGAIVIYKLQIIESKLNNVRDRMESDMEYWRGSAAKSFSWTECLNEAKKIISKKISKCNSSEQKRIKINLEKLEQFSREKNKVRSKMIVFSLLSFVNVGLALALLPVSYLLVSYHFYFISAILLLTNIISSFFSMIYAFMVIEIAIGYEHKITPKSLSNK